MADRGTAPLGWMGRVMVIPMSRCHSALCGGRRCACRLRHLSACACLLHHRFTLPCRRRRRARWHGSVPAPCRGRIRLRHGCKKSPWMDRAIQFSPAGGGVELATRPFSSRLADQAGFRFAYDDHRARYQVINGTARGQTTAPAPLLSCTG